MLDIPAEVQRILDLANNGQDSKARQYAWKLAYSILNRYGFRWEYFVHE